MSSNSRLSGLPMLLVLAALGGCGGSGGDAPPGIPAVAAQPAAPPSFTRQTSDVTITEGQDASFVVAVTGSPPPSLQWQVSSDSGGSWTNVNGATRATCDVPATAWAYDGRLFRAVASNGSASVTSTVARLTVTARAWGTRTAIETDDAGNVLEPQVAVDAHGNVLAVWRQHDGRHWNIWANRYAAGTGWGTAVLIETDDRGDALSPQIAFNTSGSALAVWAQFDGQRINIWSNHHDAAGSGWGVAAPLTTDSVGDASGPQVAFDADGNAFAVWRQLDTARFNVWASRYTRGRGWGPAVLIETDNAGEARPPRIAVDASGNALAVWSQLDGARYNVWSNRYTAGVGWGSAALIEAADAGDAYDPTIAMDARGNALAVWTQSDGTRFNIVSNRYTAGTGWGAAAGIETDNAGSAGSPRIAIDANGNAIAVWSQSDGSINNLWANRFAAGAGWGSAVLIESDNGSYADNPQIAFDGVGNAMAVWNQYRPITFSRYTAGVGWGTAALVDPIAQSTNEPTGSPQLAVDPRGQAIVVWSQWNGAHTDLMANTFR